jgi:hypothetical protein
MTPARYSCLFLFAAVLTGAVSMNAANAPVASAATQNPDGIYAVDISTRQGDCDKAYHWMISVSGVRRAGGGRRLQTRRLLNVKGTATKSFSQWPRNSDKRTRLFLLRRHLSALAKPIPS